jgi:hypothetical protein
MITGDRKADKERRNKMLRMKTYLYHSHYHCFAFKARNNYDAKVLGSEHAQSLGDHEHSVYVGPYLYGEKL